MHQFANQGEEEKLSFLFKVEKQIKRSLVYTKKIT